VARYEEGQNRPSRLKSFAQAPDLNDQLRQGHEGNTSNSDLFFSADLHVESGPDARETFLMAGLISVSNSTSDDAEAVNEAESTSNRPAARMMARPVIDWSSSELHCLAASDDFEKIKAFLDGKPTGLVQSLVEVSDSKSKYTQSLPP
jgi:hypothetical protein